ncbi:MAG: DUF3500 domain-containing protein, partial [Chloroflexi bacterium]|nr:DUF3500 domain-containing protein [Chloroflexota bacterium]
MRSPDPARAADASLVSTIEPFRWVGSPLYAILSARPSRVNAHTPRGPILGPRRAWRREVTRMASTAPQTAERMTEAATDFLEALDDDQRALAMLPFDDEAERQTWHYTPIERCGLTLNEMRPQQRRLAMRLMGSGLSMGGFVTASTIIGLEATLEGLDGWPSRAYAETRPSVPFRDPGMYYAAVFGEPGGEAPWGWRIGGHHVALQYTI